MQPTVSVDSRKNLKKYSEVCEEIRTSRMLRYYVQMRRKNILSFFDWYDVFNYPPDYSKLMTSCSSEDLNFKKHFEVSEFGYIRNPLDKKK